MHSYAQHLHAPDGPHGEHRDLCLIYSGVNGRLIAVLPERPPLIHWRTVELPTMNVSASSYRRFKSVGRQLAGSKS